MNGAWLPGIMLLVFFAGVWILARKQEQRAGARAKPHFPNRIDKIRIDQLRTELVFLRVSAACLAQRLGIETKQLPVLGKDRRDLVMLAFCVGRGWNSLIGLCCRRIEAIKTRHQKCLMN